MSPRAQRPAVRVMLSIAESNGLWYYAPRNIESTKETR